MLLIKKRVMATESDDDIISKEIKNLKKKKIYKIVCRKRVNSS